MNAMKNIRNLHILCERMRFCEKDGFIVPFKYQQGNWLTTVFLQVRIENATDEPSQWFFDVKNFHSSDVRFDSKLDNEFLLNRFEEILSSDHRLLQMLRHMACRCPECLGQKEWSYRISDDDVEYIECGSCNAVGAVPAEKVKEIIRRLNEEAAKVDEMIRRDSGDPKGMSDFWEDEEPTFH